MADPETTTGFPRRAFAPFYITFVSALDGFVIVPTMYLFISSFGGNRKFLGTVFSAFFGVSAVFSVLQGWLAGKAPTRIVYVVTLLVGVAGNIYYTFAQNKWDILIARCIAGVAMSLTAANFGYLAVAVPPGTVPLAIARNRSCFGAGQTFGPLLALLFSALKVHIDTGVGSTHLDSYTLPALATAALFAAAVFVVWYVLDDVRQFTARKVPGSAKLSPGRSGHSVATTGAMDATRRGSGSNSKSDPDPDSDCDFNTRFQSFSARSPSSSHKPLSIDRSGMSQASWMRPKSPAPTSVPSFGSRTLSAPISGPRLHREGLVLPLQTRLVRGASVNCNHPDWNVPLLESSTGYDGGRTASEDEAWNTPGMEDFPPSSDSANKHSQAAGLPVQKDPPKRGTWSMLSGAFILCVSNYLLVFSMISVLGFNLPLTKHYFRWGAWENSAMYSGIGAVSVCIAELMGKLMPKLGGRLFLSVRVLVVMNLLQALALCGFLSIQGSVQVWRYVCGYVLAMSAYGVATILCRSVYAGALRAADAPLSYMSWLPLSTTLGQLSGPLFGGFAQVPGNEADPNYAVAGAAGAAALCALMFTLGVSVLSRNNTGEP